MTHHTHFTLLFITLFTAASILAQPVEAATTPALIVTSVARPTLFITEIQTNGGSAAQEFIELYNADDKILDFGDGSAPTTNQPQWKLQFFNSSSVKTGLPDWTQAATTSNSVVLKGKIAPHDYFLISSTGYDPAGVTADLNYSPTSSHLMTDTGGGLQLLQTAGSTLVASAYDRLMWLAPPATNVLPQGVLASPASKKSLQRVPNDDNEYLDTNGTLQSNFVEDDQLSPLAAWQKPVVVEPEPVKPIDTEDEDDAGTNAVANGSVPPFITELLPNPASPQTDTADEYIEVYNPSDAPFNLKNYSLEVGATTLHDFTFSSDTILLPLSYQAFYSSVTKLSLANTTSQARLLDAGGKVVSQAATYQTAASGQAWALVDDSWQWTARPTPGAANIAASVPVVTTATTALKTTTISKPKTTKTVANKITGKTTVKKTKVTKAKTAKKVKSVKTKAIQTVAAVKAKPPIHPAILVVVVAAAVLYGLYEYRHDIISRIRQFTVDRKLRRPTGSEPARRRSTGITK